MTPAHLRHARPKALEYLLGQFRARPDDTNVQHEVIKALHSLCDTVFYQTAHIERLEHLMEVAGVKVLPLCLSCRSQEIDVEMEGRLRRYRCRDCRFYWRLGVRD